MSPPPLNNLKLRQPELSAIYAMVKLYLEDILVTHGYHGEDYGDESYEPVSKKELKALMKKIRPLMDKTALREAENIFLDAKYGDWDRLPEENIIAKIEEAISSRRLACIEYFSPESGVSRRNVEIYAKNARYTVGFCHLRKEIRKFRNSRIMGIKLLNEKFKVPNNFVIKNYL